MCKKTDKLSHSFKICGIMNFCHDDNSFLPLEWLTICIWFLFRMFVTDDTIPCVIVIIGLYFVILSFSHFSIEIDVRPSTCLHTYTQLMVLCKNNILLSKSYVKGIITILQARGQMTIKTTNKKLFFRETSSDSTAGSLNFSS